MFKIIKLQMPVIVMPERMCMKLETHIVPIFDKIDIKFQLQHTNKRISNYDVPFMSYDDPIHSQR